MLERIYLEISNICNLQCTFCPEVIREKKILTPEDFKKFALQAAPLSKQVCLHLMGEPLVHPEFREIMKICDELNLRVFLTTNGTLLKKYTDDLLNWKSLDQINFSAHSYFANPAKIALNDYMTPILDFTERSLAIHNKFYINLRLWNLAETDRQRLENQKIIDLVNRRFNVNINENIDVKRNKSKKIKDTFYLHFDTEFIWPDLKQKERSADGTCYGLRKQLAVHANGDVVPCCLDKESVLKLGNLHQNSLLEIMQSDRAKKIKAGFEQHKLIEELCRKCQYADRFKNKASSSEAESRVS